MAFSINSYYVGSYNGLEKERKYWNHAIEEIGLFPCLICARIGVLRKIISAPTATDIRTWFLSFVSLLEDIVSIHQLHAALLGCLLYLHEFTCKGKIIAVLLDRPSII